MASPIEVAPVDEWNEALVRKVHPPGWENPTPEGRYNLVVIGAVTGGLITALIASSLGGRVALVERHLMGGDCLNVGCVPSKSLIRAARTIAEARRAEEFGLPTTAANDAELGAVLERMQRIRPPRSREDSAAR